MFVETPAWSRASPEARRQLEENLRLAEDLGAKVLRVSGIDTAAELAPAARDENAGRIVIGHPHHGRLHRLLRGSTVDTLLRIMPDVDVMVIADRV